MNQSKTLMNNENDEWFIYSALIKADLDFLTQRLLLKPPLLLLSPLSQSFSRLCDLCPGLLPRSAVVPQQLLNVRRILALSSRGVWYSII